MRFLHTADWQIGMKAQSVGTAGARVREERLAASQRVVQAARDNQADFILIAGDVFEDNAVDRVLVQKTADILEGFGGSAFIIPGNHDPLVPGSVWDHPVWKSSENVCVLREEGPVELDGGFLYPCPVREKHSGKDPTSWIDASSDKGIRIGLAHGTVEGVHLEEPDCPIPRDAVERTGLDYLALGHWHSTATYAGSDGTVRMAYSGTHEITRFGERDSGNVLIVEIPEGGATPVVTTLHTGGLAWEVIEVDVREEGDVSRVRQTIESMDSPGSTLVQVQLAGLLAAADRAELDRIEEILEARFLFGLLDTSQLSPSPEDQNWLSSLPPGVVRDAGARLCDLAASGGPSSDIASRALIELYAMVGEVSQ